MSEKRKPMTEDELNAFLDGELRQTIGFSEGDDEISTERKLNLSMYLNRPVGDEVAGRSQIQDSTVQDVVESLLPSTLAPFISSDVIAEVNPVSEEDEAYAESVAPYLNHIFMVDNPGMRIQYVWQKDGLLQKNGFVYADWCEKKRSERKLQRVDYAGLVTLQEDSEIEVLEYAAFDATGANIPPEVIEPLLETPEMLMGVEFEVDYRRTWTEGRVKIDNVPPESVIISSSAKSVDDARVVGWQGEVSISDLREEGYPQDKIDLLHPDAYSTDDNTGERRERTQAQGGVTNATESSMDRASQRVWRSVVWVRVDYDGDGFAELRKIVRAGERRDRGNIILLNEEADEVLMVDFSPILMPHQAFGRCPADQAREIQKGKTALLRKNMDATYFNAEPRYGFVHEYASDETWEDLLLDIPGAPVRMNREGAVYRLADAPDLGASYQMLEYFDRMREVRTPVTRQDQGISVDALNDKTAREAQIQANATAMKKELILRLYADSLTRLFRIINRLVIKHQDKPRLMRLFPNRPAMEIDPRFWNADMDISIKVGLGTGTKDQQMQSLMMINQIQMQDMQMGLPTVDPEKLYNTRARLIEFSGLSSPEMYFNDPAQAQDQAPQGVPQEQVQQAQAQAFEEGRAQGIEQGKDATKIAEIESKERMHGIDSQIKGMELQMRGRENIAQAAGLNV